MIGVAEFSLPPVFDSDENEFILGLIERGARARYNAGFAYQIGFEDVPILSGKPAIGILNQMAGIVEGVVLGLEAESRRIKLFP